MYKELWQNIYKSVFSITLLRDGGRIASGTGFKVENKLVTNYHVIQVPAATHIQLLLVNKDSYTEHISKIIPLDEFLTKLTGSMPVESWDYAIFNIDWPEFTSIPSLNLCVKDEFNIGQPIALFGYQFGQPNLSMHSGILASRFMSAKIKYLQLDASINQGNSGGPLVDPNTSEIIGIVTRKMTGLTKQFDELLKSFEQNIQTLGQASRGGRIQMFGIDPIEGMKISQTQMAKISLEIKNSANVGIGFAYELEEVRQGLHK